MHLLNRVRYKIKTKIRRFSNIRHTYDYPSEKNGWKKYERNILGGPGVYFDPYVIKEKDFFAMYVSYRDTNSIVKSNSTDGIHWTKPITVLKGSEDNIWEKKVNRACVVNKDGRYYMWYTGQDEQYSKIGVAFSEDGVSFRKYHGNPVIIPTASYEKQSVMNPCVIWDENEHIFKMWYCAGQKYEPDVICYAISKDGINWDKYSYNPVFLPGKEEYDKAKVGGCDVHKFGEHYVMFYIGYQNIDTARICEAESEDGINWIRKEYNPIISPTKGSWDAHAVYKPSVCYREMEKKWFLWYNGRKSNAEYIGVATKKELDNI